ncbi:MAG: endolytic transglycosylase MltG [Gemmatimonadota bacterium]|nr:endolytic transglycosylase MltG [Gemmatimonadota bacterium]
MNRGTGNREQGTGGDAPSVPALFLVTRSLFPLLVLLACAAPPPDGPTTRVTIPPGSSFSAVTDTLEASGVLTSPRWFRLLARLRGLDRRVQAGIFDLPAHTDSWHLLSALKAGRVATVKFTVPEGLSLLQLTDLVQQRLELAPVDFLAAARDTATRRREDVTATSLEGMLLPETYHLPLPLSAPALVDAMLREFNRRWLPAWSRRLDSLGMTRLELLTLASIVEGEAVHDDERAVISGVYTNRLHRGMLLQADPTVQYAIERATGERKTRLYFKDYEFRSPYNTYLHPGLPPGPVNSPGIRSIEAALYPEQVPWIYFVALPDGHHRFSRTLQEHTRAIGEIRRHRSLVR